MSPGNHGEYDGSISAALVMRPVSTITAAACCCCLPAEVQKFATGYIAGC